MEEDTHILMLFHGFPPTTRRIILSTLETFQRRNAAPWQVEKIGIFARAFLAR